MSECLGIACAASTAWQESGPNQERTRREKLQQELRFFKETLAEAHIYKVKAIQECKGKSAQLAQQDAELAAVKLEVATRLAAHQKLERAAKDRSDQLQEQLAQGGADLRDAEAQLVKLQKDFRDKCDEALCEAVLFLDKHNVNVTLHSAAKPGL